MNIFSIKDLEQLSGIKAHTIRIWEQRYSFIKPSRTGTNIRFYSNEELKVILNTSLLNKNGYKVSRIDKMSEAEIKEKLLSLTNSDAQKERVVNELIQCMIELDVDVFEKTLDKYILSKGIEKTITEIVFSFLEKVGVLWQTNHVNPAQEHLVSNVIRQKLIVGIDKVAGLNYGTKLVLMFLPEGEHHELCLLFVHYLLKQKGFKVLYLGADIPVKDVLYVVSAKNPSYLYCHLTAIPNNFKLEKFFTQLSGKLTNSELVISGQLVQGYKNVIPENVILKKSLKEVIEHFKLL
jgi:DNA-binding transcriptional MerR regulator